VGCGAQAEEQTKFLPLKWDIKALFQAKKKSEIFLIAYSSAYWCSAYQVRDITLNN